MNAPLEDDNMTEFQSKFGITSASGTLASGFVPNTIEKGKVMDKWHKYSWLVFPLFVFWAFGIVLGVYGARLYFEHKMDEAVKMQRIMYKTVVYDLMVFDKVAK